MNRFERAMMTILFLAVFILIITLLLVAKETKADYMPDVSEAIRMSQEARGLHAAWVSFYNRNPDLDGSTYSASRGDKEWQERWVRHYENVINLLQRVGEPTVRYIIPEECWP